MEYKVVELREGLIGHKLSGKKIQQMIKKHALEGWTYKSMTTANIKGRIGPGGADGLIIDIERP